MSRSDLVGSALALAAVGLALLLAGRALARRRGARWLGAAAGAVARAPDAWLLAALAALVVALLEPPFGARTVRVPASGVDVVILLDVSESMRARDVPPSRLARARALAGDVLQRLAPGDRAALAAFAGRGALLTPLTPDHEALRELVPALDDTLMSAGGSRLGDGVREALRAFSEGSARPRLLLVLSDGEDPEQSEDLGEAALRAAGARVVAVAFGSETGGSVTLRAAAGRSVRTRAEPERLATLARGDGALFTNDRFGAVDADAVVAALRRDAGESGDGFAVRRVPRTAAAPLAGLAFAALLAEAFAARRRGQLPASLLAPPVRSRRRRPGTGALAAAALLLVAASDSQPEADALSDRVRQAPEDARSLVALGVARGRAGDLAEAERAFFAAAVRAREVPVAADAYYDLGVAALGRGDLEGARDAFFDAIALAPGDRRAQFNLEWTLRALAERKTRPPESQKPRPSQEESKNEARPEPAENSEPRPEPQPVPGAAKASDPGNAPLSLDPATAKRWLDQVSDDPARALQAAARPEGGEAPVRRSAGPLW